MTGIHTAIIPAAGLGTRMRPATEAVPKELLPVGGHPALDWVLHEAIAAGIDDFVIVTSDRKPALEHYVTEAFAPRVNPATIGSRASRPKANFRFVAQATPAGLGDAVRTGWRGVGDEPVAVLLPDELILGGGSMLASMLEHHDREARSMVALVQVRASEISSYGCGRLSGPGPHGTTVISGFVEKPDRRSAPSAFAICGRYVLGTEVRRALETTPRDRKGEIQLTDALDAASRTTGMPGLKILPGDGRIDIGNWSGWLQANIQTLESGDQPDTVSYRLLGSAPPLAATLR
jgi:UTP--glucose-1-phosphate uridylyltransferase